jgi:molecular chaperone DnaK (HSP70)
LEGGRPVIIPSEEGAGVASGKAFPSFVAFTKDGQRLVGEPVRRQAPINSEGTMMLVDDIAIRQLAYEIFQEKGGSDLEKNYGH